MDPALNRSLVFIGFMGAGKSTAAKHAAKLLGVICSDSDDLIEAASGMSAAQHFEAHGTPARSVRRPSLRHSRITSRSCLTLIWTSPGVEFKGRVVR